MKRECSNCQYWRFFRGVTGNPITLGTCHLNPPSYRKKTRVGESDCFPETQSVDFCGQHYANETARREIMTTENPKRDPEEGEISDYIDALPTGNEEFAVVVVSCSPVQGDEWIGPWGVQCCDRELFTAAVEDPRKALRMFAGEEYSMFAGFDEQSVWHLWRILQDRADQTFVVSLKTAEVWRNIFDRMRDHGHNHR